MIFREQPPAKNSQGRKGGENENYVKTKEINYLQVISDGKVIKESSQVPQNKTLKIFHQNIIDLGNKTNELYCYLHHDFPHILCI